MRVSATAKYLRGSTRKARLVTTAIKGKPVEEAAALLKFMPQYAAKDVARVLHSATANAEPLPLLLMPLLPKLNPPVSLVVMERVYA